MEGVSLNRCCMPNVDLLDDRAVSALRYLVPFALIVYMENNQIVIASYLFTYTFQSKPIFTFHFTILAVKFVAFGVRKFIESDDFEA